MSSKGLRNRRKKPLSVLEVIADDLLIQLCEYLSDSALLRLAACSKTLYERIFGASTSSIWRIRSKRTPFVIGHTDSDRTYLDRYRSARKWHHNLYDRCWLMRFNRQIPSVAVDGSSGEIFISFENRIMISLYDTPIPPTQLHHHHIRTGARLQSHTGDDITRFAVSSRHVFAGTGGGDILVWKRRSGAQSYTCPFLPHSFVAKAHMSDIHMVDAKLIPSTQQLYVSSASKEGHCSLWRQHADNRLGTTPVHKWQLNDRVWSTKIDPIHTTVAAGTACINTGEHTRHPILLYDMETGTSQSLGVDNRKGAGILDMQFSTDGRLLYSCGYDSSVRLWDRRIGDSVWQWDEPFDSVLYSLAHYDDNCLLIGSGRHSVIWLLDKRFIRRARKGLYITRRNSPVYSVALLPGSIFAAVDAGVRYVNVD